MALLDTAPVHQAQAATLARQQPGNNQSDRAGVADHRHFAVSGRHIQAGHGFQHVLVGCKRSQRITGGHRHAATVQRLQTAIADNRGKVPQTHQLGTLRVEALHTFQYAISDRSRLAEHLLGGERQVMQNTFAGSPGGTDDTPEISERHQVARLPELRLIAQILLGKRTVQQVDNLDLTLQADGSRMGNKTEFHAGVPPMHAH